MSLIPARFSKDDVAIESEETVFQGFLRMARYQLKHRMFKGGWSQGLSRELYVANEAAAGILYDPVSDSIALIEQFRIGALKSETGPWCLEVVAGIMEPGESADELMLREISEEAGIDSAELIPITTYYSTPGVCAEKIHVYCALCDLSNAGGNFGLESESEDILLHVFKAEDVFANMLNDRTNNAATLIALLWLQLNRPKLLNRTTNRSGGE